MNRTLPQYREVPAGYVPLESTEPWERGAPDIGPSAGKPSRFILEPWSEITFDSCEEWLVKRFLPRRGVAVVYGKPASFKSFVAFHIALSSALGCAWADRTVFKASVVYILISAEI
jgi:AAA domain